MVAESSAAASMPNNENNEEEPQHRHCLRRSGMTSIDHETAIAAAAAR